MPNWKKVLTSGSAGELLSLYAPSITGSLLGTATSASYVNTLNQNVLITGSLTIGATASGANENTLIIGPAPAGGSGEGGQLLLQAQGGTYTSASMLDNWQNKFRILRGTNAGSDAYKLQLDLHSGQLQLPNYNSTTAFTGTTLVGILGFDASGNILTTSTSSGGGGGGVTITNNTDNYLVTATGTSNTLNGESNLQFDGSSFTVTGNITSSGTITAQANGAMYFRGGDDAELWDINVANTIGIYGQQNSTVGSIKLGSGGGIVSGWSSSIGIGTVLPNSGTLHVNGNVFATSFTGSLLGTASYATHALSSSYAVTASYANYAETASRSSITEATQILVLNQSGYTITKGLVVHITASGNSSDIPRVISASYENDSLSANTLGIATQNITNGSQGYVITEGVLTGIDTSLFQSGQLIFLGSQGTITGSAPHAPLHSVRLGQVIREQSNNGSIHVRVDNGYELGELHDITDSTTSASYGDLLVKSGSIWTSGRQLTGSYGLTGSLSATSFTGSLLGTASYSTIAHDTINKPIYTVGILSGSSGWTAALDGTITLPAVQAILYNNSNHSGSIQIYNIAAGTTGTGGIPALTNNDTNYIFINYNSGTPAYDVSTTDISNDSDIALAYIVYRLNNFVHVLDFGNQGAGLANKISRRLEYTDRFGRESGLTLSLSGSTGIAIIAGGIAWNGTNRQTLAEVNSNDDVFFKNYRASSVWTVSTTGNFINTGSWDNGTDLVTVSSGKYLVNWYYRGQEINDHIYEVISQDEYDNVSDARLATEPILPELISSHAFLTGRIIVQSGSYDGIVESAFATVFQSTTVTAHNDLTAIQGGTSGEYYHLTQNQVNNLVLTNTPNQFTTSQTITGSLIVTAGITGSLQGTASWAQNAITSSYINTLNQDVIITGSVKLSAISNASASNVLYYDTASGTVSYDIAPTGGSSDTSSLLITASFTSPNIVFTKGDSSTFGVDISSIAAFPITVNQILTASILSGTSLTLPNSLTFLSSSQFELLNVFVNGLKLRYDIDFIPTTTESIQMNISIPSGSEMQYISIKRP